MSDSPSNGNPPACPFARFRCLRHVTEEELALLILGGLVVPQSTIEDWPGPKVAMFTDKYPDGAYLCTCGAEYNWDGSL